MFIDFTFFEKLSFNSNFGEAVTLKFERILTFTIDVFSVMLLDLITSIILPRKSLEVWGPEDDKASECSI